MRVAPGDDRWQNLGQRVAALGAAVGLGHLGVPAGQDRIGVLSHQVCHHRRLARRKLVAQPVHQPYAREGMKLFDHRNLGQRRFGLGFAAGAGRPVLRGRVHATPAVRARGLHRKEVIDPVGSWHDSLQTYFVSEVFRRSARDHMRLWSTSPATCFAAYLATAERNGPLCF